METIQPVKPWSISWCHLNFGNLFPWSLGMAPPLRKHSPPEKMHVYSIYSCLVGGFQPKPSFATTGSCSCLVEVFRDSNPNLHLLLESSCLVDVFQDSILNLHLPRLTGRVNLHTQWFTVEVDPSNQFSTDVKTCTRLICQVRPWIRGILRLHRNYG